MTTGAICFVRKDPAGKFQGQDKCMERILTGDVLQATLAETGDLYRAPPWIASLRQWCANRETEPDADVCCSPPGAVKPYPAFRYHFAERSRSPQGQRLFIRLTAWR